MLTTRSVDFDGGGEFDFLLSSALGCSRRTAYDLAIRYALYWYGGRSDELDAHPITRKMSGRLREQLIDGPLRARRLEFVTDRIISLVIQGAVAIEQVSSFLDISIQQDASVAIGAYA